MGSPRHRTSVILLLVLWLPSTSLGMDDGVTCTSYLREFSKLDQPISFKSSISEWATVEITRRSELISTCMKGAQECDVKIDGFTVVRDDADSPSLSVTFESKDDLMRELDGNWTFDLYNSGSMRVQSDFCSINVYEPPSEIECATFMGSSSLQVDCETDRIYPEPDCLWTYKHETDTDFMAVYDTSDTTVYSKDMAEKGRRYFKSTCSIRLERSDVNADILKFGGLLIQAQLFPGIAHPERSFIEDNSVTAQAAFQIDRPDPPVWRHTKGDKIRAALKLKLGESIDLRCEVPTAVSGSQIAVVCGFPITSKGLHQKVTTDNNIRIKTKATLQMDAKTCVCWGEHIGGRTTEATLLVTLQTSELITEQETGTDLCESGGGTSPIIVGFLGSLVAILFALVIFLATRRRMAAASAKKAAAEKSKSEKPKSEKK